MSDHKARAKEVIHSVLLEATVKPKGKKPVGPPPWWKPYVKYGLTKYPINIPREAVTIDLSGDIDTHAVMTWIDPKSGKKVHSYTKPFMAHNAAKKWSRTSKLSSEKVEEFKTITARILTGRADEKVKQAAAVISIIAQTGLRPGSQGGFEQTGNRGVLTLGPTNISIKGNKITLSFVGKSYKENMAEITDGPLANYLQGRIQEKKGENFLFDISNAAVDSFYKNTLKMSKFKIKDLRTHMAGQLAIETLETDVLPPPPIPEKPSEIKKVIKNKLKHVFDIVSKKLNNTPAMAKNSYINPRIISNWLDNLGIQPQFAGGGIVKEELTEDEEVAFDGDAPVYKLPNWWDDPNIELVKKS